MDSFEMEDRKFQEDLDIESVNFEYFMRKTSAAAAKPRRKNKKRAKKQQKTQNHEERWNIKKLQLKPHKLAEQVNAVFSRVCTRNKLIIAFCKFYNPPTPLMIIEVVLSEDGEFF